MRTVWIVIASVGLFAGLALFVFLWLVAKGQR